jgi:hypothetical protein
MENTALKRPTLHDPEVIAAAARKLAPAVKQWVEDADVTLAKIEADLREAIKFYDDGYAIARELDGQYDPDARLVDILDQAYVAKSDALRALERDWVQANQLQPIPLETKVRWQKKPAAGQGIVVNSYPEGKSTVMFPSLGHVRKGVGCHGCIANWEELTIEP